MRDFFFGPFAITGWFLAATIFIFCASYIWLIVREVGGLRGSILATMFTCLAVVCSCFGLILSDQTWVSGVVLGAVITSVFPAIVIGAVVLTDLYSSDRNGHRSFTARSYQWYKRVTKDEREERDPRHPIRVYSGGRNVR